MFPCVNPKLIIGSLTVIVSTLATTVVPEIVRLFPTIKFPLIYESPLTSRRYCGLVVPIPNLLPSQNKLES